MPGSAYYQKESGKTRRTVLSPPMKAVHVPLPNGWNPLGATVKMDAAGNLRALFPRTTAPRSGC